MKWIEMERDEEWGSGVESGVGTKRTKRGEISHLLREKGKKCKWAWDVMSNSIFIFHRRLDRMESPVVTPDDCSLLITESSLRDEVGKWKWHHESIGLIRERVKECPSDISASHVMSRYRMCLSPDSLIFWLIFIGERLLFLHLLSPSCVFCLFLVMMTERTRVELFPFSPSQERDHHFHLGERLKRIPSSSPETKKNLSFLGSWESLLCDVVSRKRNF